MELRDWLRKNPQPAYLVCDGKKIAVSTSGSRKWAETAETVEGLGASAVEAYDKDGTLLRRTELEGDDGAAAKKAAPETEVAGVKGLDKMSELAQLAAIIGDISDRSARRHEAVFQLSFNALMAVVQSLSERVIGMEQAWITSLNQIAELRLALADAQAEAKHANDESLENGLIQSVIGSQIEKMAKGGDKPNGKANGKPAGKKAS